LSPRFFSFIVKCNLTFEDKIVITKPYQQTVTMAIDLNNLEMFDFHAHCVEKILVSELIHNRSAYHLDFLGVAREPVKSNLLDLRQNENRTSPYYRALIHYIAMSYGCKAELGEVDRVLNREYERNFTDYIRSVLNRERVQTVQLAEPTPDLGEFPRDRAKWAFRCDQIIQPEWSRERGAKNIGQALDLVEGMLEWAVKNGCVGVKTCIAYYRGLDIESISEQTADNAFKELEGKQARRYRPHYGLFHFPEYDDPKAEANWKAYVDYIVKRIVVRCGELDLPFHCHTGGGVSPSMDIRKVNPTLMYSLFYDEDIANTGTTIVLLHCGVPFIAEAASAASQFPYVYVDTSWPTRTETIKDIFRICLREVSPRKILYGSDSSDIGESLGLGAWTARKMLGEVLDTYKASGWTEEECYDAARQIFSENGKRLLKIA